MAEDAGGGEKSEEPTQKKIGDASKKGQVAQSQEIQSWAVLLTITLLIGSVIPIIMSYIIEINRNFIEHAHDFSRVEWVLARDTSMEGIANHLSPLFFFVRV